MNKQRSQWSSSSSYLLVTIGAVVGLGNIIQFPFLVAKHGGLFILFYILCELLVTIPLFIGELIIGRRGKQNPVGAISLLSMEAHASMRWGAAGWLCVAVAFLTLCYYSVQAAFPLAYLIGAIKTLSIYGVHESVPVAIQGKMMTNFFPIEVCFLLILTATLWVIVRGIKQGLETISWIVIPTYFFILLILAIFTVSQVGLVSSITPLFHLPVGEAILPILFAAMSYAFFKLNVGMGTMIVYGSYLPYSVSFGKSTLLIVLFDMIISLLAYLIINPLMIAAGANFFMSNITNHNVVYVFSSVPYGILVAAFFFLVAVLAAWTCTIAMAETVAVTLMERFNFSRPFAVLVIFIFAVIIGSFAALTHTVWLNIMLTAHIRLAGIVKNITSIVLAPLSAFFIAIFIGWIVERKAPIAELTFKPWVYRVWYLLVKSAPLGIALIVLLGWVS